MPRVEEQRAYDLGCEHARAAASWVIDGNTPTEHIERLIAWLDDGDPRVEQFLPRRPDLSGEWADGLTPNALYREVTGYTIVIPRGERDREAFCDAYEQGVADTFEPECEQILRAAVS